MDNFNGSSAGISQLNMNIKMLVPEFAQESIVTLNKPGWKDTRLKIGLTGEASGITPRSYGKALAKTAVDSDPFMVSKDQFSQIIAQTLGIRLGVDRRITVRKENRFEVQYMTLMSAVSKEMTASTTLEQRNALTMWIAVALSEAGVVQWGGPLDLLISRQTERILATDENIRTEHLIWMYITEYESRIKPALSSLMNLLTRRIGYYDTNAIADNLCINWTTQQIEIRREKAIFSAREEQFKQALFFLLKGLPTIPDPLSSIADVSEFFKISNFLIGVDFSNTKTIQPKSFAEARSYLRTVRSVCMSENTKLEIVPTLSFQKYFTVKTTSFATGVEGSQLRDVSLNYTGSDMIRAGEVVQFMGDYKQWGEDPALSSAFSSIVKSVLSNLREIKDIRLETWANVVDNMSDVSLWLEDNTTGDRLLEIDKVMQAYAIAGTSFLTRDNETWVYSLLTSQAMALSSSDATLTAKGSTTRKHEVAVSLMLSDREGDPLIGNPTPYYKATQSTYILAEEGVHYNLLKDNRANGQTGSSMIPLVTADVALTDGSPCTVTFPLSSIVSGSYPTTSAILKNIALQAEVKHLYAQLNESLQLDQILTGERLIPVLKRIAKVAMDAFESYVKTEVLSFPSSMNSVRQNYYKSYVALNSINILVAVCGFIEPDLAILLDTLFAYALSERESLTIILGVL